MPRAGDRDVTNVRPLTPADLETLGRTPGCEEGAHLSGLIESSAWSRAAMDAWGFCGLACAAEGAVSGFVLVSPAAQVPREHPLAAVTGSDTAALLALVDDGSGRRLVQSLAARLVGRPGVSALDAAASPYGTVLAPSRAWLDSAGFRPVTDDPARYRLDLRATRAWLPDLGQVWSRLREAVRPAAPPEPAMRASRPVAGTSAPDYLPVLSA